MFRKRTHNLVHSAPDVVETPHTGLLSLCQANTVCINFASIHFIGGEQKNNEHLYFIFPGEKCTYQ